MERLKILVIGTLMFTFGGIMSCGNVDHSRENGQEMVKQDTTVMQILFPFPAIPEVLTSPVDRKSYLLIHYWEQFDFADTMLVNNRDVTEQGFVNFIALLADGTTPEELTRESLENWCAGFVGKDHARKVLTQTADSYLFNPNSPFYNEGLYGMYLEALLGKLPQTDAMRSAYRFKLELVKRNNYTPHTGHYIGEERSSAADVLRPRVRVVSRGVATDDGRYGTGRSGTDWQAECAGRLYRRQRRGVAKSLA